MHSWLGRQPPSRKGSRDSKTSEHSVGRDQGVLTNVGIAVERAEANVPVVHAYEFVNDYFDVNHDALQMKMKNIASDELDTRALEDILNGFIESSRVLIKGLKALGHLHPFIITAVGAFSLVTTLDSTRRENDRKVLAVKVQMQDLMKAFFELRHVHDPNERGPDGLSISDRLNDLITTIAKDIKACGSACDAYMKKSFLMKAVKCTTWETRLSEFSAAFFGHRIAFELALQVHTSLGDDSVLRKLDEQDDRLQSIDQRLDMLLLFRKLDSPRERDIQKFIEDHGGAKACILDETLLAELVAKSGESLSRFSAREIGRRSNELLDMKRRLLKELQEDIEDTFTRNLVLFERKLDVQSKQFSSFVQDETDFILNTLLSGAHDRIVDSDLSRIWKEMGWKGSVKARHFVLALHDFYSGQMEVMDSPEASHLSALPSPNSPTTSRDSMTFAKKRQDDQWALAYVNAAYVQPILEAVDDDGTGFVSIKEVNTFVTERPENWTLPHWIAYWAVGWQASMSHYKEMIYELVQTMFRTLEYVLPSNRKAVDEYLFHPSFWRIELLLRSMRSVNPKVLSEPELIKMTESYQEYEEERLDANLNDVAYELDTMATVALITGAGRIERYAFPLIYLLLRRHLQVMKIACKHVLDPEEFVTLNESLVSVLLAVDHRIENLEAIFKQTQFDVQARLANFAFGMFHLSYGDIKRIPANNSFATWVAPVDTDSALTSSYDDADDIANEVPERILKYGIQDGYSVTNYYEFDQPTLNVSPEFAQIEGTWSGHYSRQYGDNWVTCILRVSIRIDSHPKITGKGEDFAGAFEFMGLSQAHHTYLDFTFIVEDEEDGTSRTCTGRLQRASDTIVAQWKTTHGGGTGELEEAFTLQRTPPYLLRYKYTPQQFAEDPVRSRWAFACSSALHQAQAKLWSRRFFEEKFQARRRYVKLTTRALIVQLGLSPYIPLTQTENQELESLRQELDPSEARFYQALSEFEIQKLSWHPSWGCDGCGRQITRSRILCVDCMSEDLSDNIDLCMACIDKAPSKRNFTHQTSHTIVKVEQTLHDYHIVQVVNAARAAFKRAKAQLTSLESSTVRRNSAGSIHHNDQNASSQCCACCGRGIWLPCWVCAVCSTDVFICSDCDNKHASCAADNGHLSTHPLVRVHDVAFPNIAATTLHDDYYRALDRRLDAIEFNIQKEFTALEARENARFASLEARMDSRLNELESRIDAKFQALEAIFRQIASQTATLPSSCGQEAWEHTRKPSVH